MRESKLFNPIKLLFESRNYNIFTEINILYSCIDVIALKNNIIISIEMKMSLTKKLIRQAYTHKLFSNYVYVAVKTKPIKKSIDRCKKYGLGIICVKNDKAFIILESKENNDFYSNYRKILTKRCLQSKNNKIAGLPQLKGIGPRIDCKKRVKEYLKLNKNATWKEIFNNVSNHYCNYKSMACAIGGK